MLTLDEIALLREIARWRRNHKVSYFQWRPGKGFGVMTEWKLWVDEPKLYEGKSHLGKRQINVTYEPDRSGTGEPQPRVVVTKDYYGSENFRELPTSTVTETIDCLAALGYLPARFSSAYRAGWESAMVWEKCDAHDLIFRQKFGDPENISFPAVEPAW